MKELKVSPGQQGQRLDVFISAIYPDFSRSSLDSLFDFGKVKLNGEGVKAGQKIKPGDSVRIDDSLLYKEPAKIKLLVIYEDDDVVVIDKPAGVLTHSKGALNLEPTVASFIKPKITDKKLTGNRAGIVHRLDRATSGVIITAKNSRAQHWLQKQFSSRQVKKTYRAVVDGVLEHPKAVIEAPIARNPKKPQTFMVSPAGKPAITEYRLQKVVTKDSKNYSLTELEPLTGRTHQLRVHLAYVGHPVVGDPLYGHKGGELMLHAESLQIALPNGQKQAFEAELPERIKDFIAS